MCGRKAEVPVMPASPLLPNKQGSWDTLPAQPRVNQPLFALLLANLDLFYIDSWGRSYKAKPAVLPLKVHIFLSSRSG